MTRVGLVLNPAERGSHENPSLPQKPTSTLFPSEVMLKIEAKPSFIKKANLMGSSTSFKTVRTGSETNSSLENSTVPSASERSSRILLRSWRLLIPLTADLETDSLELERAMSSSFAKRLVRFRRELPQVK